MSAIIFLASSGQECIGEDFIPNLFFSYSKVFLFLFCAEQENQVCDRRTGSKIDSIHTQVTAARRHFFFMSVTKTGLFCEMAASLIIKTNKSVSHRSVVHVLVCETPSLEGNMLYTYRIFHDIYWQQHNYPGAAKRRECDLNLWPVVVCIVVARLCCCSSVAFICDWSSLMLPERTLTPCHWAP